MNTLVRRAGAGALVLAAALGTGWAARGIVKESPERAEPFRVKGPASAKVTIVEFSDFQCPACRVAEPPLSQIMALFGPDVRLVFKHFPLERIHPWARQAAVATDCAGRQGAFWPFHDLLYERQADWTNEKASEKIDGYARGLNLDMPAFTACRGDASVQKAIDTDIQEARNRWVGGTPTFFINGKRFVNARQLQERGTRWISQVLKK